MSGSVSVHTSKPLLARRKMDQDELSSATIIETAEYEPTPLNPVSDRKLKKLFIIIFCVLLLDLLSFTMILPLLPTIFDYYEKSDNVLYKSLQDTVDDIRNLLNIPNTRKYNGVLFGGFIGSLFSLLQFLSCPLMGALSDRYGRKNILLFNMVCLAVSYILWACSYTFSIFIVARIVEGISHVTVTLVIAIIADITTAGNRGKGMALVGVAFAVGFTVGPSLGAAFSVVIGNTGFSSVPGLFAVALTVTNIILVSTLLPETLPYEKRLVKHNVRTLDLLGFIWPPKLFSFASVKDLSPNDKKCLRQIGITYFIYLFLYSGLEFTLTFLMHQRFAFTSMQQGKMFFIIGIIMTIIQGGYIRRVVQGKEKRTIMMGMLIIIPSFLIVGFSHSMYPICVGIIFYSIGSTPFVTCMNTIVSRCGDENQKGEIVGITRSIGALSRTVGPGVASAAYWLVGPDMTYIIGGLLMIAPLIMVKHIDVPKSH